MNKTERILALETEVKRLKFDLEHAQRTADRVEQLVNARTEAVPIFRDGELFLTVGGKWIAVRASEKDPGPYSGRLITAEYMYDIEKRVKSLERKK